MYDTFVVVRFVENIRMHLLMRHAVRHAGRQSVACGLDNAKRIGILYHAGYKGSEELIRNFAQEIKTPRNEVRTLGFVPTKHEDELPKARLGMDFFGLKGLDFSYRSSAGEVITFTETPFDMLIDLNVADEPALLRICADSAARFKVGGRGKGACFLDLLIENHRPAGRYSEVKVISDLIKHIQQYAYTFQPGSAR